MPEAIVIIIAVGLLILLVFVAPKPISDDFQAASISSADIPPKWREIKETFSYGKASNLSKAIMDADKLFDEALKLSGVRGKTMGERLRNARERFDREVYNEVWEAHKLRNYYAHEMNAHFVTSQVKQALDGFEKGLKALRKL